NCGGTEHLGPGLYHSGLVDDVALLIRQLAQTDGITRVVAAGYSLGGNLALRLAGTHAPETLPTLKGVCAVSPVLDLEACVRALERRSNFIYQWDFVRNLKNRMRRKQAHFPRALHLSGPCALRTLRPFHPAHPDPHLR